MRQQITSRQALLGIFVAACVSPARATDDRAVADEMKLLRGDWKIVAVEQGGEQGQSSGLVNFSDGKCTITHTRSKTTFENTFTIDPTKSPKRIVVTNTRTKEVWAGIYELKGDELRCLFHGGVDSPVPTEFKTKKDSVATLYTYERVKVK